MPSSNSPTTATPKVKRYAGQLDLAQYSERIVRMLHERSDRIGRVAIAQALEIGLSDATAILRYLVDTKKIARRSAGRGMWYEALVEHGVVVDSDTIAPARRHPVASEYKVRGRRQKGPSVAEIERQVAAGLARRPEAAAEAPTGSAS
jgi:hypothetical protein